MLDEHALRRKRVALDRALAANRSVEAEKLLAELVQSDPQNPRWSHKRGDLQRKLGQTADAIESYSHAVDTYAALGFIARAAAMAKTVLQLDPTRLDILERVDPEAAHRLRQRDRPIRTTPPRAEPTHRGVDGRPTPKASPPPLPPDVVQSRPASPPPAADGVIELELADLYAAEIEGVEELHRDPSAGADETRFPNAPPPPGHELQLRDEEIQPRRRASEHEELFEEAPAASVLAALPLSPLFADVPRSALTEMIAGADLVELGHGELVMRKGDPADAMYGVIEGCVEITVPDKPFRLTLAEGDVFGETCLLENEPRHVDAIVQGKLVALRIPRSVIVRLLRKHPPLAETLLELLTRRLLGNLFQTSELFSELSAPARRELARAFELRRAPANTVLAVVGKKMDGLYISLTGTLELNQPGAPKRIAQPGSMFGQQTLLTHGASQVDITTCVDLFVLRLPAGVFARLSMQYPTILATVTDMATSDVVRVHR